MLEHTEMIDDLMEELTKTQAELEIAEQAERSAIYYLQRSQEENKELRRRIGQLQALLGMMAGRQ
jgi:hypothetical protein